MGMSCIMSKRTSSYSSTITLSRCPAKFTHSPNTPHSAFPTHYPHTLYHTHTHTTPYTHTLYHTHTHSTPYTHTLYPPPPHTTLILQPT